MQRTEKKGRLDPSTYWIIVVIVCSVFSQIESIDSIIRPAMYVSWLLVLGLLIVRNQFTFSFSKPTSIYLVSYSIFAFLNSFRLLLTGKRIEGNYFRILAIPLLVSIVAELYKKNCKKQDIQILAKMYVLCALIYALWVNSSYFTSYNAWLSQRIYVFELKNSAAQIWSVAVFLLFFYIDYKSISGRVFGYGMAVYLIIIAGLSQCRTAILALGMAAIFIALFESRRKVTWILCFIVFFLVIWNIPITRNFIDQAFFLNKYKGADLDTFSSGRLHLWENALRTFIKHPIFGTGKYYVDCSYILVLAETGLIGFLLIEPIWLKRIIVNLKYKGEPRTRLLLTGLTIFYIIESALEGYPPFGPGVSSFMFWLLSVILIN